LWFIAETKLDRAQAHPRDPGLLHQLEVEVLPALSINEFDLGIPITLNVGSLIISGQLSSGKRYFEEFARDFASGLYNASDESKKRIEESFKKLGEDYKPLKEGESGETGESKMAGCHRFSS
jgi:hypothetical protein